MGHSKISVDKSGVEGGAEAMAKWNKDKKVLDHEHTQFWKFDLKDVVEPNLQKDVFPYDEVCRIDFDHKIMSINPAEEMFITDTTFRDGQQAVSYTHLRAHETR